MAATGFPLRKYEGQLIRTHFRVLGRVIRNQWCHTTAHNNPKHPKMTKIQRHGMNKTSVVTIMGVNPPLKWAPAKNIPWMVPRSRRGIQRENVRAMLGHAPASPAPNRNRTASNEP